MNDMKQMPLVSIIIPVYNGSNYLGQAIDSAIAQTYNNIEIIVVNDGSTDDGKTERIALSYGDRIKYYSKTNGGSSSALNYGIKNMSGEWFSWLSHDDLYKKDKVKSEIDEVLKISSCCNEAKYIVFTAYDLINESGRYLRRANSKRERIKSERLCHCHNTSEIVAAQMTDYSFHGCSCLINKKAIDEVGYFDENLKLVNDTDMWFRLIVSGYQIVYLPTALVNGRVHKNQISREIGFSYHNKEQDFIWNRSFDWIVANGSTNDLLKYANSAFQKARFSDGEKVLKLLNSKELHTKYYRILMFFWKTKYGVLSQIKKMIIEILMK